MSLTLEDALKVLAQVRGDKVVLTTMASIGIWPGLSDSPLDFAYMPSSMGQGPALGLGLALAHPERGVVVVNGDGSMLMNLGCLVTLASYPAPVYLIVMDNGLYEVTGGQPTVGSNGVDFAGLAKAAGFQRVYVATTLEAWKSSAQEALSGPGPAFIWLKITGRLGAKTPQPPRPMAEQIQRLRKALDVSP